MVCGSDTAIHGEREEGRPGRSSSSEKQIGRGQGGVNKAGARNESQGAPSSRAIAARRNGRRRVGSGRMKSSPVGATDGNGHVPWARAGDGGLRLERGRAALASTETEAIGVRGVTGAACAVAAFPFGVFMRRP